MDKQGRTGLLTLTTVLQEIRQDGELVIREEQDIVYRAAGSGTLPPAPTRRRPRRARSWTCRSTNGCCSGSPR